MAQQKPRVSYTDTERKREADFFASDPEWQRDVYRREGATSRGASMTPDISESSKDISRGLARANAARAQSRYTRKSGRR